MDGISCDICDKPLLVDEDVRFVVDIQVYAAYDPMELTQEDLAKDRGEEIKALLRRTATMDAQELEDGVHKRLRFDLCPECRKTYLKHPLPRAAAP